MPAKTLFSTKYKMHRYAILTQDPQFCEFWDFIKRYDLEFEAHLNRTHVILDPNSTVYTEFLLRFSDPIRITDREPASNS